MEIPISYGTVAVPPSLNHFAIYNPTFGPTEETQKDQLLYYVAKKTVPIDVQMRQIGLAQGLINFTSTSPPNNTYASSNSSTQHDTSHSSSNLTPSTNFLLGPSHLNVDDSDIKPLKVYLTKKVTDVPKGDATEADDVHEGNKEYRYVFFNKLNLAIKSSLYPFTASNGTSSSKGLTITSEMAHALCDLHEDLEKHPHLTEIYTRSTTNFWIVGKRSDGRVLYVVVPKKEVSLMEVE
ncbi:3724_t:CDS:2, partial [Racocetra fulgida]